jgi:hypothetical protein
MYEVKIIWQGGPTWDPSSPSSINSDKTKTPIEHLVETGGQTIDETIDSITAFNDMPIIVKQMKILENTDINWVTSLTINTDDEEYSMSIVNKLTEYYEKKKLSLMSLSIGYSIDIEINKI